MFNADASEVRTPEHDTHTPPTLDDTQLETPQLSADAVDELMAGHASPITPESDDDDMVPQLKVELSAFDLHAARLSASQLAAIARLQCDSLNSAAASELFSAAQEDTPQLVAKDEAKDELDDEVVPQLDEAKDELVDEAVPQVELDEAKDELVDEVKDELESEHATCKDEFVDEASHDAYESAAHDVPVAVRDAPLIPCRNEHAHDDSGQAPHDVCEAQDETTTSIHEAQDVPPSCKADPDDAVKVLDEPDTSGVTDAAHNPYLLPDPSVDPSQDDDWDSDVTGHELSPLPFGWRHVWSKTKHAYYYWNASQKRAKWNLVPYFIYSICQSSPDGDAKASSGRLRA